MSLTISRIDRVYRHYDVAANDADGNPAVIAAVDVALLTPRATPTATTVWTTTPLNAGSVAVLFAGPDADDDGALVVPEGGADVWLRITDNPEVDAEKVERVSVS